MKTGSRMTVLATALASALITSAPAVAEQPFFATAEEALAAFREALAAPNGEAVLELLGPEHRDELIGGDPASVRETMAAARNAANEAFSLAPGEAPGTMEVLLGRAGWPMPIPLVEEEAGWRFDIEAGLEEIIDRRIGENELAVIEALRAYVAAQRLYGGADINGDGVPEFAQRLISTKGERDGLFWPTGGGEEPSPLAPLAASEDEYLRYYRTGEAYYGYNFRILTRQGDNAPGGAYDYVINGHMIAGFALIAWPADYGNSGIMTFMVSHLGEIYEADLGEDTQAIANSIDAYDPGDLWSFTDD